MKRYILLLFLLGCGLIARAQIIQGATVTVENEANASTAKGYKGYAEAGLGVNLMSPKFIYELTTTHGYQFEHLFLGIGTGLTTLSETKCDRVYALPLYGEARWFFSNNRPWKIYAGFRIGYNIHLGEFKTSITEFGQQPILKNYRLTGLYGSPGFGVEYKRLNFSINYLIQGLVMEETNPSYQKHTFYDNSTLLFRIGVNF